MQNKRVAKSPSSYGNKGVRNVWRLFIFLGYMLYFFVSSKIYMSHEKVNIIYFSIYSIFPILFLIYIYVMLKRFYGCTNGVTCIFCRLILLIFMFIFAFCAHGLFKYWISSNARLLYTVIMYICMSIFMIFDLFILKEKSFKHSIRNKK